jgi:A/G-specific adenine glycosylase
MKVDKLQAENNTQFPYEELTSWFKKCKRDLPWRGHSPDPYHVWVSEIMLQQTQVSVVIPYFLRWMGRFPTIESLAMASQEEVIKLWEGLGYYSRARNLHQGAREVMSRFSGKIPSSYEELSTIKGLGPYTVGAILMFAFRKKAPAVDGNVIRVLSRFFGITDDVSATSTQKRIRQLAESCLPESEPWVIGEAWIELGALVCKKVPQCSQCPLKEHCHAYKQECWDSIPFKASKTKYEALHRIVAVFIADNHILIRKGQKGEIMQDLHEFPYVDVDESPSENLVRGQIDHQYDDLEIRSHTLLRKENHSFTRYRVTLYPYLFHCASIQEIKDYFWYPYESISELPFSSGHKRVLNQLQKVLK